MLTRLFILFSMILLPSVGVAANFSKEFESMLAATSQGAVMKPNQLLTNDTFRRVIDSPEQFADDIFTCFSATTQNRAHREICLLLIQMASPSLFARGYNQVIESWRLHNISTNELADLLGLPVNFVNRLQLQYLRPEIADIFDKVIKISDARALDQNEKRLRETVLEIKSGKGRRAAISYLNAVPTERRAYWLAVPESSDMVSVASRVVEELMTRDSVLYLAITFMLLLPFLSLLLRKRTLKSTRNT